MPDEEEWWRRRPYLRDVVFSLIAATTGLLVDLLMSDRPLADALPPRVFHFVVLLTILCTIETAKRRFIRSPD